MTARRGAALAFVAAGAFGASSPLVKRFAPDVPALVASWPLEHDHEHAPDLHHRHEHGSHVATLAPTEE